MSHSYHQDQLLLTWARSSTRCAPSTSSFGLRVEFWWVGPNCCWSVDVCPCWADLKSITFMHREQLCTFLALQAKQANKVQIFLGPDIDSIVHWTVVGFVTYFMDSNIPLNALDGAISGSSCILVSGATLAFNQANIRYVSNIYLTPTLVVDGRGRDITDESFQLSLQGSLTNVDPQDALIKFVDPVTHVFARFVSAVLMSDRVMSQGHKYCDHYQSEPLLLQPWVLLATIQSLC